jgi:hypothetical protein
MAVKIDFPEVYGLVKFLSDTRKKDAQLLKEGKRSPLKSAASVASAICPATRPPLRWSIAPFRLHGSAILTIASLCVRGAEMLLVGPGAGQSTSRVKQYPFTCFHILLLNSR